MHVHVLGVGGTFMSAIALLARAVGHRVTGSDENCYPPISNLLSKEKIKLTEGYHDCSDAQQADCIIVGNTVKRGTPIIEAVLDRGQHYQSGPEWLYEHVLSKYRVIAVTGTHGKSTTTSMLTHILEQAGLNPGFLIGGIASNFNTNARLGEGEWFVIEADEYDTAFFDKRPKFMHYRPECAVINNLEFDHADIYPDLAAIQLQFHYFLKTLPPKGALLYTADEPAIEAVLAQGVFSRIHGMQVGHHTDTSIEWYAKPLNQSGSQFEVTHHGKLVATVKWNLIGLMNIQNGLSAISAAHYAGVDPNISAKALSSFKPTKRRLELRYDAREVKVYDDFAHHPTAIEKTLISLREANPHQRVLAILEFASHSMRMGVHGARIPKALMHADEVYILAKNKTYYDLPDECKSNDWQVYDSEASLAKSISNHVKPKDAIVVMSNRSLELMHQNLTEALNL